MLSLLRMLCFAFAAIGAASCHAQSLVQPTLQDGSVPFARYGLWTIYQSGSEMFDNQLSCAAVASLPGTYDAIRVERVADGFIYGINGFDRASFGKAGQYPIAYWFDEDRAQRTAATGRFVKDPAFADDDWLSLYRPHADAASPLDAIYSARSITFEVRNPGNRTGDNAVRTTFPLGNFEVVQRALDRCFTMGLHYAETTEGPIPACRDDGTRLPISGLCMGAATALLRIAEGEEPALLDESCSWVLTDGWFADMVLLYRALQCEERTARLAGSSGAHMVQLELIETAYAEPGAAYGTLTEPVPFADVYARFKPTPAEDVQTRALFGLQGQVPASCAARRSDTVADGYIVDVSPAVRAREPQDEPPAHLCGPYGYGDDSDLWRVFQGHAWFLKLGQDVPEIDFRSLTLLEPDGVAGWKAVR
jgi:hypothetical protein